MLVPHAAIQTRAYHVVNERIPGNQFRINPAEKLDPREQQVRCIELWSIPHSSLQNPNAFISWEEKMHNLLMHINRLTTASKSPASMNPSSLNADEESKMVGQVCSFFPSINKNSLLLFRFCQPSQPPPTVAFALSTRPLSTRRKCSAATNSSTGSTNKCPVWLQGKTHSDMPIRSFRGAELELSKLVSLNAKVSFKSDRLQTRSNATNGNRSFRQTWRAICSNSASSSAT